MKSKYLVITLIFFTVLLLTSAYLVYQWIHQPVAARLTSDLSKESKNRIEKMKESGEVATNINIAKNAAGKTATTNCFSTVIPLPFSSIRTSEETAGKCLVRTQLSAPRGTLVVHSEYFPNTAITEISGVAMRSKDPKYSEIAFSPNHPSTLAFKSATEVTIFNYREPVLITISFSELGRVDQEIIDAAQKTLDSIQIFSVE